MDYRSVHIYLERLGARMPSTLSNRDWVDYKFGSVILRLQADGSKLEVEIERVPRSRQAIDLSTIKDELELGVGLLTWAGGQKVQDLALGNFSDELVKSLEDYVMNGPIVSIPQQASSESSQQRVELLH